MSFNVNLLPSQAKFQANKIKLEKKVRVFVWIFGSVWLSAVFLILAFWLIFKLGLESSKKEYLRVLSQYKTLSGSAIISEKLKYRAKLVGKVLGERFEYGESMSRISSLFSSEVNLENIEIKEKNHFEISGTVKGIKGIDEAENKVALIESGQMEGFAFAKILSLVLTGHVWDFKMEVETK